MGERRGQRRRGGKKKTGMFKVIVQECKMSAESGKERASDVANGCKLIAVMWILIPINQGQCGLLCHLCAAGGKGWGGRWGRHNCTHGFTNIFFFYLKSPVCESDLAASEGKKADRKQC